jgi:hypothetical protein
MLVYLVVYVGGPGQRSRYGDSLPDGRSGNRISVGARFSTPVQTGPGVHPASLTRGTGFFPGVKLPGRGVALIAPRLKCRAIHPLSFWIFVVSYRANFTVLPFYSIHGLSVKKVY